MGKGPETLPVGPVDAVSANAPGSGTPTSGTATDEGMAGALRAVAALRRAAGMSPEAVMERTAQVLAGLSGCADAALIVPSGSSWRVVGASMPESSIPSALEALPPEARHWSTVEALHDIGLTLVPVRPGSLALALSVVLEPSRPSPLSPRRVRPSRAAPPRGS